MKTLLCDVDGVVADLMAGFIKYMRSIHCVEFRKEDITRHHIGESPALKELDERWDFHVCLEEFLATPNVYEDWVPPTPNAGLLNVLQSEELKPIFLTATMKTVHESYTSKCRWLNARFPSIPIISCPSELKHIVRGDYIIEDRYDTCLKFEEMGTTSILFGQPWNEASDDVVAHDWKSIERLLTKKDKWY